jgi:S1-C subfamily serine protease
VPKTADGPSGSGTAFFVNNTDLVTAEHVVSGCNLITLADGTALTVIGTDASVDLAVLESPKRSRDWLSITNAGRAKLGEKAYVLGYPYYQLAGTSLNFTTGNVSALAGALDDKRMISISAPVQPGNSGGPLLNGKGEILGVVSARLSEFAIAEATGTLPQNINYAVTGAELIGFLNRTGVLFPYGQPMPFDMDEGAPERIQRAVVPVLCW